MNIEQAKEMTVFQVILITTLERIAKAVERGLSDES